MSECTEDIFLKDVANHEMIVIRDDGVNRHIRFKKPGTICMYFDFITWPGYLCYTGDMGTYVFQRLEDMFEFFRTDSRHQTKPGLRINLSYWGEKLQAIDRGDGYKQYSPEKFKANVMDFIKNRGLTGKLGHGLMEQLQDEVLDRADEGADIAYNAAHNFEWNGKEVFTDFWEYDSTDYSFRYVWCCYALAWGIRQYDNSKEKVAA